MPAAVGFNNKSVNQNMLMSLPVREASGAVTLDYATPRREVGLVNTPTWTTLPSGLTVMEHDGVNQYLQCPAADTVDLNFITEDYSFLGWVNWVDTGMAEIVIGRYGVDLDGWEIYLELNGGVYYLTQRHHHAGVGVDRSGCYSTGWTTGTPWLLGITRVGGYPIHYRNGVPLTMVYDPVGGLFDPTTCARDLVIGTRFTKDANWYEGTWWNYRIVDGALSALDHMVVNELEKHRFN